MVSKTVTYSWVIAFWKSSPMCKTTPVKIEKVGTKSLWSWDANWYGCSMYQNCILIVLTKNIWNQNSVAPILFVINYWELHTRFFSYLSPAAFAKWRALRSMPLFSLNSVSANRNKNFNRRFYSPVVVCDLVLRHFIYYNW